MSETPPHGWTRLRGKLWRHTDHELFVATRDMDLLRFLGAALDRFDHMSPAEFDRFVAGVGSRRAAYD